MEGASRLFDAIRSDHFRAFEQYWAIPAGAKSAKAGAWEPGPGMDLLGVLTSLSLIHISSAAGDIAVCRQGRGLDFDEDLAKKILTEHDVEINIAMGEGTARCTCWGCDITYDYIKINGDYRT